MDWTNLRCGSSRKLRPRLTRILSPAQSVGEGAFSVPSPSPANLRLSGRRKSGYTKFEKSQKDLLYVKHTRTLQIEFTGQDKVRSKTEVKRVHLMGI